MKNSILTVLGLFLFVGASSQTKNFIDQPYLEVNAIADTMVPPDEIYIRILVSEKEGRDRVTIEEQETKMAAALQSLGIYVERDLSVTDIASNFQYHLFKNRSIVKVKSYSLKVGDALTVTRVFAALEEAGFSNASIERVDHSSIDEIKNSLRTRASRNAKDKAVAITSGVGQKVGTALHLVEHEQQTVSSFKGDSYGLVVKGVGSSQKQANVEFQKIRVVVSISAKFSVW